MLNVLGLCGVLIDVDGFLIVGCDLYVVCVD